MKELTKIELQVLEDLINTEIMETKDLLKKANGNDKKELEEYLSKLNSILVKLK